MTVEAFSFPPLQSVYLVNERGIDGSANMQTKALSRPTPGPTLMGSKGRNRLSDYGPFYKHLVYVRVHDWSWINSIQDRSVESLRSILGRR
jgi:hypothetical protein